MVLETCMPYVEKYKHNRALQQSDFWKAAQIIFWILYIFKEKDRKQECERRQKMKEIVFDDFL